MEGGKDEGRAKREGEQRTEPGEIKSLDSACGGFEGLKTSLALSGEDDSWTPPSESPPALDTRGTIGIISPQPPRTSRPSKQRREPAATSRP